jgi:hypothetical protein
VPPLDWLVDLFLRCCCSKRWFPGVIAKTGDMPFTFDTLPADVPADIPKPKPAPNPRPEPNPLPSPSVDVDSLLSLPLSIPLICSGLPGWDPPVELLSESSEWGWTCHLAKGDEALGWLIFLIPVNVGGRPVIPSVEPDGAVEPWFELELELEGRPTRLLLMFLLEETLFPDPIELRISPAADWGNGNPAGRVPGGEEIGEPDEVVLAPDPSPEPEPYPTSFGLAPNSFRPGWLVLFFILSSLLLLLLLLLPPSLLSLLMVLSSKLPEDNVRWGGGGEFGGELTSSR